MFPEGAPRERRSRLASVRRNAARAPRAAALLRPGPYRTGWLVVLIPAFVLSELKTAFIIGFVVFVPFLIIDLVVSSTLIGPSEGRVGVTVGVAVRVIVAVGVEVAGGVLVGVAVRAETGSQPSWRSRQLCRSSGWQRGCCTGESGSGAR